MNIFLIIAGLVVVAHLVAACSRPRTAVIVSGALWALYAYYERQIATGALCDANCNIRVDLVFILPILGLTTYCAYQSYAGRPGQMKVIAAALGIISLFAVALVMESTGYAILSGIALLGALAIVIYAIRARRKREGTES